MAQHTPRAGACSTSSPGSPARASSRLLMPGTGGLTATTHPGDVGAHRRRARSHQHHHNGHRKARATSPATRECAVNIAETPDDILPVLRRPRPGSSMSRRGERGGRESIERDLPTSTWASRTRTSAETLMRQELMIKSTTIEEPRQRSRCTAGESDQPWPIRSRSATLVSFTRGRPRLARRRARARR